MDSIIIPLGIRWLAAVDAFSASCVSHEWRRLLSADRDDNGAFWKQICLNSGPSDIPNLQSSADYYRHLAMGLRLREVAHTPPPEEIYTPTTRPEDYFAVVDVYRRHEEENGKRRKEMITSFVCTMEDTEFTKRNEQLEPIFQGPNPYSANMSDSAEAGEWRRRFPMFRNNYESAPFSYAAWKAAGGSWYSPYTHELGSFLRFDVSLFRRDTAKSVRLIHDASVNDSDAIGETEILYPDHTQLKYAATDIGRISRSLMNDRSVGQVTAKGALCFAPLLPSPFSSDEPTWLVNCRVAIEEERRYEPNEEDMAVLSTIDHFDFGVKYFYFNLWLPTAAGDDMDIYEFESQDEFLVVLEGLCWE